VIQALAAPSFNEFKTELGSYPGSAAALKHVYDACHAGSFTSATEPRLARNVQRLAELEPMLAPMPADEREAARDRLVRWIRQEESEMPNTSYDQVGQSLERVEADVFCDTVEAQLNVTLTLAERAVFTALHDQLHLVDFINWDAQE